MLSDESAKELGAPMNDISASIMQLFKHFMPMPLSNIFRNVAWREPIYSGIMEEHVRFQEAKIRFEFEQFMTPILVFLQEMATKDGSQFQFRENDMYAYISIPESLNFLKDWLKFQFRKEQEWRDAALRTQKRWVRSYWLAQ